MKPDNPCSLGSVLIGISIIILVSYSFTNRWSKNSSPTNIRYDVYGYYLYLPAIFIYDDLSELNFHGVIQKEYFTSPPGFYQAHKTSTGKQVIQYPCGLAVHYSPFFFIAHKGAAFLGQPQDGFSWPYKFMLNLGAILYALLGLWFLRKSLLHYFNDQAVAVVLLILVIGSNYLHYTALGGALTHNWLFTDYCLLLWMVIKWNRNPNLSIALGIGALIGLMVITRPVEMIAILIPLFWGVANVSDLKNRLRLFYSKWNHIILAVISGGIVISLQLIYWKYATGQWVYYSYGKKGFDFLSPHFFNGMFSCHKGWFMYTPMMLLAILGFYPLFRLKRSVFWAIFPFFLLNIYIVFSWQIWWYGGSLGQRALVQSYALLAFPLTSLVQSAFNTATWRKVLLAIALCIFTWHNIMVHHQSLSTPQIIDFEYMSRSYYWRTFWRFSVPKEVRKLQSTSEIYEGERSVIDRLTPETPQNAIFFKTGTQPALIKLNKDSSYFKVLRLKTNVSNFEWVRFGGQYLVFHHQYNHWKFTKLVFQFKLNGEKVSTKAIAPEWMLDKLKQQEVFIDVPNPNKPFDEIAIYFDHTLSDNTLVFTNPYLEFFNEK